MKNLYYLLWVDAIINDKSYKNKEPGWKLSLFGYLTTMNALNMFTVLFWLKFFNIYEHTFWFNLNSDLFSAGLIEAFFNSFLPFAIVNYLFVFRNNRYKKLIGRYSHFYGRLALFYSLGSICLLVTTVVLIKIF